MGAFTKLLLLVFVIQFVLISTGLVIMPMTSLYEFAINPTDWDTLPFSLLLGDLLLTAGGLAVVAGSFFIKNDLLVFGGLATILFTFGKSLSSLWSLVNAQGNSFLANLIVSPIILIYVITLLAWWRGRES
jgi:hypothetical protein